VGIPKIAIEGIEFALQKIEMSYNGLKMCEMGCQTMHKDVSKYKTGKEHFSSLGVKHTSIDWKGNYGSKVIDLRKPIKKRCMISALTKTSGTCLVLQRGLATIDPDIYRLHT